MTSGREKVKYYRRPQVPGSQASIPLIRSTGHSSAFFSVSNFFSASFSAFFSISLHSTPRYAPDVSHVPDDFTTEFLARRDSYSNVRRWEARNREVEEEEKYSKRGTNLK